MELPVQESYVYSSSRFVAAVCDVRIILRYLKLNFLARTTPSKNS